MQRVIICKTKMATYRWNEMNSLFLRRLLFSASNSAHLVEILNIMFDVPPPTPACGLDLFGPENCLNQILCLRSHKRLKYYFPSTL